jgi:ferredoxin
MLNTAPSSTGHDAITVQLLAPDGSAQQWRIAPDHPRLLLALLQAGAQLPSSCRNGSCRACLSKVLHGRIEHVIEWPSLSADERAAGLCLPCVARATSDTLQLRTDCLFET